MGTGLLFRFVIVKVLWQWSTLTGIELKLRLNGNKHWTAEFWWLSLQIEMFITHSITEENGFDDHRASDSTKVQTRDQAFSCLFFHYFLFSVLFSFQFFRISYNEFQSGNRNVRSESRYDAALCYFGFLATDVKSLVDERCIWIIEKEVLI